MSDISKSIERYIENEKNLKSYHQDLNIMDDKDLSHKINEDAEDDGNIEEHIADVDYIYEHDINIDFESNCKDIGVIRNIFKGEREKSLSFMSLNELVLQIRALRALVKRIKMKVFDQMVENDALKKREEDE